MPATLGLPLSADPPPHKLWTRSEYETLERQGLLDPDRYELIAGELLQNMPKNLAHVRALLLLTIWLRRVFGDLQVVQEPSLDLDSDDSLPEPDAIVLRRSINELTARPHAGDVLLLAEISSTTLAFDLTVKARLYARAAIAEYWVLDLAARRLIVHRSPLGDAYQSVIAYDAHEPVSPLAAPEHSLLPASLLDPA